VRDLVVQPRDSDLVIATHGRGIWIVDDTSPLRKLTPDVLAEEATFVEGRPTQQRLNALGGWPEGNAAFSGPNPPDGALITYYQKKRHIFGKMKIEIFDPQGNLVDTVAASSRRGLTRVSWPMRLKPPRVPPAATAAFEAAEGPRILPGTYTVKMTRGQDTYSTQLVIGLDRRAKFNAADRQSQFGAAMRVYDLLGDMTFDVDQINGVRDALGQRAAQLPASDPLRQRLVDLSSEADEMRKKIVATKEGGAITGEERIREKTAQLYGAITEYEGRPGDYQIARIDSLRQELGDVKKRFDLFAANDLAQANASLAKKKLPPIHPITRDEWNKANGGPERGASGSGSTLASSAATAKLLGRLANHALLP
jgi:hypothetical protein